MTIEMQCRKEDFLEVLADCPTFESDLRQWCARMKKVILWIKEEGNGVKRCMVQV